MKIYILTAYDASRDEHIDTYYLSRENVDGPYIDSFIGFKNGLEGPKYILTCVTCAMSAKQPQPQPQPDEINDPISRFKPY